MAKLVFKLGGTEEIEFDLLTDVITLGRAPDNDVVINNSWISSHHVRFRRQTGTGDYEMTDLGSHNGTFVNGERINSRLLRPNDAITLGHLQAVYLRETPSRAPAPSDSLAGKAGPRQTALREEPDRLAEERATAAAELKALKDSTATARAAAEQALARAAEARRDAERLVDEAAAAEAERARAMTALGQVRHDLEEATRQLAQTRQAAGSQTALRGECESLDARRTALLAEIAAREDELSFAESRRNLQEELIGQKRTEEEALALRVSAAEEFLRDLDRQAAERRQAAEAGAKRLAETEAALTLRREELSSLNAEQAAATRQQALMQTMVDRLRDKTAAAATAERREALTKATAALQEEHDTLAGRVEDLRSEQAALQRGHAETLKEWDRQAAATRSQLQEQQQRLVQTQADIERDTARLADLHRETDLAARRRDELSATLPQLEATRQELRITIDQRQVEATETAEELARQRARLDSARLEAATETGRLEEARHSLTAAIRQREKVAAETVRLEAEARELAKLQSELARLRAETAEAGQNRRDAEKARQELESLNRTRARLQRDLEALEDSRRTLQQAIDLSWGTVHVLAKGLIRRLDLIEDLHAACAGHDPELAAQVLQVRDSLLELLRENSVEPYTFGIGTPLDITIRKRITILEAADSGGDVTEVAEVFRPGYVCHNGGEGGQTLLRKAEVRTTRRQGQPLSGCETARL